MSNVPSWICRIIFLLSCLCSFVVYSQNQLAPAVTKPIPIQDIIGYANYSNSVKKLIAEAASLSQKNLTYLYGSADPKNRGMDCSGTIYYLLSSQGIKDVPRSSEAMYQWVKKSGHFHSVKNYDFTSNDFAYLNPGDLLFWSGTYNTGNSNSMSHVMIYLGENSNHEPLMFGSSDGRTYQNKKMWGVSIFDFKLPRKNDSAKFIGYSCIPTLTCKE